MSASVASSSTTRATDAAVSTVPEVVHRLGADASRGLSTKQAEERRQLHGLNEFIIKEEDPLWKKYLNQVCSYRWALFGVIYFLPLL